MQKAGNLQTWLTTLCELDNREAEIDELNAARIAGMSNEEIRGPVARLEAKREEFFGRPISNAVLRVSADPHRGGPSNEP